VKIAAALPTSPTFEVFSRKCGVSEMNDAGTAIPSLFAVIPFVAPRFCARLTAFSF
jgi:hypothetical protein